LSATGLSSWAMVVFGRLSAEIDRGRGRSCGADVDSDDRGSRSREVDDGDGGRCRVRVGDCDGGDAASSSQARMTPIGCETATLGTASPPSDLTWQKSHPRRDFLEFIKGHHCLSHQSVNTQNDKMKLDSRQLRYLTSEDWRVLTAVCIMRVYNRNQD